MYGAFIGSSPAIAGLIRVQDPSEIEFLVKESEVVTNRPGRSFFVQGNDRSVFQVELEPYGLKVVEFFGKDEPPSESCVLPERLNEHALGDALRSGRLFTCTLAS